MSVPRIVSLVPSLTELVCELGLVDRLVGRTGFCIHPGGALATVPKVGGTKTVNIDRIRRLAPTHLIVNVDENEKPTVDVLAQFIPNVIVTHPVAVEDNFELYRRFGRLFDAEPRAIRLCQRLQTVLDEVDACRHKPLPVAYLIWNDPWMTVSSDTFIANMLARVGLEACAPVDDARYPALAPEAIAGLGACALLLSSEPCRFGPADRHRLRQILAAAGRGRVPVLGIDGAMSSWYGPRAIDGLRYLLAYRRRLEARLERRSIRSRSGYPAATTVRTACAIALTVMLGALAACSGLPTVPADAATQPATAGGALSGRGRFYLDDGPGDRPLAELEKTPDAVPKAEPLHSRANRPYTVFGRDYEPMTRLEPYREHGIATWYGRRYHGRPTAIGESYDMYAMTAAHPTLPLPSYARVTHVRTGRSIVVRVNDRGPFLHGRVIDLSYAAAAKLASALPGSAEVEVELITRFNEPPAPAQAGATPTEPQRLPPGAANPAPSVQVLPVALARVPESRGEERSAGEGEERARERAAARSSVVGEASASNTASPDPQGAPGPVASISAHAAPGVAAPSGGATALGVAADVTGILLPGRYVQLGAYKSREGAEAALQGLRARGLPEPVTVRRDGAWHKLIAGPFAQPAGAQNAQRRLRAATGIDAFVLLR